jgi:carbon-monoxide dehydrogenase medium subunit
MKPPRVRYVRPETVREALGLLDRGSLALAGGQSLMPLINLRRVRPERLVDLGAIEELQRIEAGPNDEVVVGAGVTMARLGREPIAGAAAALLGDALLLTGNPQVRARGTIGGNLAHGDSVSELATALVALGASVTICGPAGERLVPVEELALEQGELLVDVRIPGGSTRAGGAVREVAGRYAARALAVAAAVVEVSEGALVNARIAVGGVATTPVVLAGLDSLAGVSPDSVRIAEAIAAAIDEHPACVDPRADERYRRDAAAALAGEALLAAARCTAPDRLSPAVPSTAPAVGAMPERDGPGEIAVTVNGRPLRPRVEPRMLLCDLLRGVLGLHPRRLRARRLRRVQCVARRSRRPLVSAARRPSRRTGDTDARGPTRDCRGRRADRRVRR